MNSHDKGQLMSYLIQQQQIQLKIDNNNIKLSALRRENEDLLLKMHSNGTFVASYEASISREIWSLKLHLPCWFDDVLLKLPESLWKDNFRMERKTIMYLTSALRNRLEKEDTKLRCAVPIEKRVAAAIFKLTSCAEYRTVATLFGIGISTVCTIVHSFCLAVIETLGNEHINFPITSEQLLSSAATFQGEHSFPQAIGAVGGIHVPVSLRRENAWDYYNYEGWCSIVLLAVVDGNYKFRYVKVSPGSYNHVDVFTESTVMRAIEAGLLDSNPKSICDVNVPYILLTDSGFPLMKNLIRPYDNSPLNEMQRQFNYQHFKAHYVIETALRKLKARFALISKRLELKMINVNNMIYACTILHNICECFGDKFDPSWEMDDNCIQNQPACSSGYSTYEGHCIRDAIAENIDMTNK